ncbi:DegT/DnrJ/EryC1/StrS family aminotransferase [Neobacillus rhizosphaerae]|uniref:DegT/DnrJ/EryC1/StrS family aminotransferase n=1 Tax=Neobacillus rhizosphaerae TaxID=2880965 RepID=UPI003D29B1E9
MDQKILVTRSSMPSFEEYVMEIKDIWDSGWLTNMGVKHKELEKNLSKYLGVENTSLFSNGHLALEIAIQAMDLSGEVITTPFTFASTTHAIIRSGLKPVFCDIDPQDYTIDVKKIESLVTERTSAIIPVHVYGNICDVEEIDRIAKKYDLKVIYDAAHTFGVKYKGSGIGSFGDASMFSFHATKVFNTIEGGAVCFSNPDLGEKMNRLKNFGIKNEVEINEVGTNAKMNEFQAAMGLCNLRNVNNEIAKRKTVVERYRKHLDDINGIQLSPIQKDVISNYAYFPIIIDKNLFGANRDEISDELKNHDIFSRKYFYPLTNTFDCFHGQFDPKQTPIALSISETALTLPLYADLSLSDVDRVCDIILSMRKSGIS